MLHVLSHPLASHLVASLRDQATPPADFRTLAHRLGLLLAMESTRDLATRAESVQTPLETTAAHRLAQLGQMFGGQTPATLAAIQFGQKLRDRFQPQPVGQPLRGLDPPVDPHQQRNRRAFIDQPGQPPGIAMPGLGLVLAPPRGDHHHQRGDGPAGQQQAKQEQRGRGQRHAHQLCARRPDYNRIARTSCGRHCTSAGQ